MRPPAGSFVTGTTRMPLETTGDLGEVAAVLVGRPDVGPVRPGDPATLRRGLHDPAEAS